MTHDLVPQETPIAPVLCLVCAAPGWALGWRGTDMALTEQAWPDSLPPVAFPTDLWSPAVQLALREHWGTPPPLCLCWAPAPEGQNLSWWPGRRRRLPPWRALAREEGLTWAGATAMEAVQDLTEIWPQAQRAWANSEVSAPGSLRWPGPVALTCVSALVCVCVHSALQWGIRPWIQEQRALASAQAEQDRQAEQQRLLRERERAVQVEQVQRTRQWAMWQSESLRPLQSLAQVLGQTDTMAAPQFWQALRYADGAWTVQGVASHESDVQPWWQWASFGGNSQLLESAPGVWPPEPEWGWPAWRFRARWSLTGANQESP